MIHIVAVISWSAGLLYLPRLFVYHCKIENNREMEATFQVMEKRLFRIIMNPAMVVTIISGGILSIEWVRLQNVTYWLITKIFFVLCLTIVHMCFSRWRKALKNGTNMHSERFFRIANEVPTAIIVIIVIFVVLKPF